MLLLVGLTQVYGFRIVSYNVENLFDCTRDSTYDDSEFTAEGLRCWTPARYYAKRERIARTIVNIGGWTGVALVGLCEVENERCVRDLCRQNLKALPYSYVHFDSSDPRGIDVALLYRTDMFRILHACLPVRCVFPRMMVNARRVTYCTYPVRCPRATPCMCICATCPVSWAVLRVYLCA